ncbi:hypothetical protein VHUM_00044 [Vanrija humicola]|uniref:Derlin n=1 Tax=Vanrija humicola TaxID=5417 RepID=A0A7D8Z062_VANHU|nr:hypothetical protein VHUM_00044 [Vanrija humicola]
MQPWRFLTTFTYFGDLNLDFAFRLYSVMRYSYLLETNSFANKRGDYVWLMVVMASLLLAVTPFVTVLFLANSLNGALSYIWSRRSPSVKMSLFGVVTLPAPYMPFVLVGLQWLLFNDAISGILGIAVGHVYVFLQDFWPREMWSSTGKGSIKTPQFV